jgi:hypothetical protein
MHMWQHIMTAIFLFVFLFILFPVNDLVKKKAVQKYERLLSKYLEKA